MLDKRQERLEKAVGLRQSEPQVRRSSNEDFFKRHGKDIGYHA